MSTNRIERELLAEKWKDADKIAARITDVLNENVGKVDAMQALVGLLLAFKALEKTMPPERPATLVALIRLVDLSLNEIFKACT